MMWLFGIMALLAALIVIAAVRVPLDEYERLKDDEAQMEFIKKWNEEHNTDNKTLSVQ